MLSHLDATISTKNDKFDHMEMISLYSFKQMIASSQKYIKNGHLLVNKSLTLGTNIKKSYIKVN